jgi:RND superfamily putative drug exporter
VLLWVAALALAAGLSAAFSDDFSADYSAPGSDSRAAQDLLTQRFPEKSGDTVDVVVRADGNAVGNLTAPAARADVEALLDRLGGEARVASVDDPYATPGSISADGRTLVSRLRLDVTNPVDMPIADAKRLLDLADAAERPGLEIALGGQSIQRAEQGQVGSEGIGLVIAAIILLLTFGTVVAAGLPIIVAVAGLALTGMLTGIVAAVVDVPDWSTALASMMVIGIGIDYVLLMVTRFREWRSVGLDPEAATAATLDTAGRSALVAGSTVVVSMLGLFGMGLSFMRGAATVTILGVLIVMAASLTLFPALLGYLGKRIDRLRLPLRRRRNGTQVSADGHVVPSRGWVRWSRLVERHRVGAALVGVAILLGLAAPFLSVRFGLPDAGNDATDKSTRRAYDLLAEAFGPGANGPLLLAATLPSTNDTSALESLAADIKATPGVAAVTPPQANSAGDTAVLLVVPTTGPQDEATKDLVSTLRDVTIPTATSGTGVTVNVGGVTATSIDGTSNIAKRIPLLIGGVVVLSMLLLLLSFRSVVIPIKAAAMNLLSVTAAYGVLAFVLEGGWAGQLIGIDTQTPLPAFIPVLMFAILFGLSMDYEVFLLSRVRESWMRTKDSSRSVVDGLAGTGRVITAAAAIMIAVFAAFILSPEIFLKEFGVGMAAAVLIDATVVRMLLVPSVMLMLGRAAWLMPAWLARRLPQFRVEGRPETYLPQPPLPEQQPVAART